MRVYQTIKLLLADDMQLFRRGLTALFGEQSNIEVVAETADSSETLEQVSLTTPTVAVLEVLLPGLGGIATCRRIRELHPTTEVLFLSSAQNEAQMREAFEAGARAYLLKTCDFDELLYAVRKVSIGDYYLSGPAGQDMVADYVKPLLQSQRPGGVMTRRERELAKLLADGYSTKESAQILNISPKTAETHRSSIMKKLNARNVTDIVKYCIRNYLIEP